MSHDADKLIRQLSLVAFLMAERRLLTARDVKSNVEGYSEMSDEAFARRFYSDRAELTALGVPLQSQRDEFTGEELYTLRSEHYFLDRLDLDDDELAALQTALYYLEGKFAYAEPFRLALQNLALGRAGFTEPTDRDRGTRARQRAGLLARARRAAREARVRDLEAAHCALRLLEPTRVRDPGERTVNPYALRLDDGNWYVIGHDLDRDTTRTFKVSRIRGDIRFATRRERDFRVPADFDVEQHRIPRPWQIGEIVGRARIAVSEDTAWWVERTLSDAGTIEDGVFETDYANVDLLAGWVLRQNGRAVPLEPDELVESVSDALASLAAAHGGDAPTTAGPKRARPAPASPRASDRPGRARALRRAPGAARPSPGGLRRRALGDPGRRRGRGAVLDPDRGAPGPPLAPEPRELRRRLLRGLRGARRRLVRVEKELYGDVFRRPPKLTPLEARAIRLAIEYVGPTIAADAHTPLKRVRKKLEETFGRFDLVGTPQPTDASAEESLVKVLSDGRGEATRGRDRVPQGRETRQACARWSRTRSSESFPSGVSTRGIGASMPRGRSGSIECGRPDSPARRFEARDGFDPSYLRNPRVARLLHSPAVARWKLERGARPLTDGSAIADVPFKTEEWLLSEVLADRGETMVLEPQRLRDVVAKRARRLQRELGRVPSRG